MYNYSDGTVHFKRRKCSTSPAVGVQLERYIHYNLNNMDGMEHLTVCALSWLLFFSMRGNRQRGGKQNDVYMRSMKNGGVLFRNT